MNDLLRSTNAPSQKDRASKLAALLNAFLHMTSTKFKFISTNDAKFTEHVLTGFVGFIYTEIDGSVTNKYQLARLVMRLPCCNLSFKISNLKLSDDAQLAVDYYKKNFNVDEQVRRFYEGWFVEAKDGKTAFFDLTSIYLTYDEMHISQIHESVKSFAVKEACNSLKACLKSLGLIIKKLPVIACDSHTFHDVMSSKKINKTISCIYSLCLNDAVQSEHCLKTFHVNWQSAITVFKEVFVKKGIVGKPRIELLAPEFKTSGKQVTSKTKERKGKDGNAFNNKLITPIPLSYSDTKAKELIFESIKADINHVTFHCRKIWDETMKNHEDFKTLAEQGQVRPLVKQSFKNPLDMTRDENVCATFRQCGFRYQDRYNQWLLGAKNVKNLTTLLALPTITVMQAFCYLLIEIHPSITPSWLAKWDLYDDKGDFHGFKEVKGVWIALSKKERKGKENAQQEVMLTVESKKLIEEYLELTQQLRTQLQQESNDGFRKMLISAETIASKAQTYTANSRPTKELGKKLAEPSKHKAETEAVSIAKHLTHSRMRSAVGVRVYLETGSVHAMAEALGHEKYVPSLISHYLPKPLWDYFTNRWIRQFQNAIVYEAMKDSRYLHKAIDIHPDELNSFLEKHGLGELPEHIRTGKKKAKDIANDEVCQFDEAIFLVSTSLLQLFMALVTIVDNAPSETKTTQFAKNWYEAAKFVLSHISVALKNREVNSPGNAEMISNDIAEMYRVAANNPLNNELIEGAILCQSV
ncbi:hypothetical protein [Photobacterium chitinilyticum]|uniref:hypothetical protein n=1 Tax=Photobacterium chitinilyticum TaxID=2485123 RepID=UPI000FFEEE90|nr:hypothetical protein [Photobacterium chitinilyticum]